MTKEAKAKKQDPQQQLSALFDTLVSQHTEFTQPLVKLPEHEFAKAGLIQGLVEGNSTPTVMLMTLTSDHWEYASDFTKLEQLIIDLLGETDVELWPIFAALYDGDNTQYVRLFSSQGTLPAEKLPTLSELKEYKTFERDKTFRWSMKTYTDLMKKLNFWHESVFRFTRDNVDDKNAIIEEVAKLLFLESFRVHHDASLTFKSKSGSEYILNEIFTWQYVEQHGAKAVELIRDAFEALKSHEDYIVVTDDGTRNPIFSERIHINLNRPENFISLLKAIQDLGPVTDNHGKIVHAQGNLGHVSGDLLGRVFDVFLRANFDSKGGNGVYLTPNPVKQAMVDIALHDIASDSTELARLSNGDFRFCDPTCGSFGFGSVVLSQLQKLVDNEIGISELEKEKLKETLKSQAFTGADSTPRMVMLARVNMALQGAPKAQIFQTQDSLVTQALKPNSFDLICTNPPFGSPGFGKNEQESKKDYERHMEQVLGGFRPTQKVVESYNAYYDHIKMKWQDTGDLELDDNGEPKWAGYRTDLRKTGGTDKKPFYSLQPTTSGLALGSKPDSKGNWQPVGATIDPAVLFIDRNLQLLKPGGRLMIVLPDGILCNSGDRYVREYIMGKKDEKTGEFVGGKAIVKAVISLPSDCFKLSGTGAKTSILYLQKRHANPNQPEHFLPEPQTEVFMAVAETLGYVVKNNIEDYNTGVTNDLDKIVSAYKRGE